MQYSQCFDCLQGADSSKVGDLTIVSWLNESNASIVDIQGETVSLQCSTLSALIVYRGAGSSKVGDLTIVSWLNESNASIVDIQGETVSLHAVLSVL